MKFLNNEKNLYTMPVLYLIATAVFYIVMLSSLSAIFATESIIEIVTVLILFAVSLAYKKKENNMLKTLMGALLFERVFYAFGTFARMVAEDGSVIATVLGVLYLFCYILFFIVHISIDIKDTNASGKLAFNTVVGILIVVINLILLCCSSTVVNGAVALVANALMELFMVIELLSLERKIIY